ncbi:MAG TPA: TlpA disulfide reductase family protein [Candidatus Acidoferrales bacterium]|nr:TlpA disulfide reductase family protein [Candidatus Acidoferrales bacterium]
MKSWVKLALVVVTLGAVIGVLAYGFYRDPRYIRSPLVGREAPSFALRLFDGRTIRLEDFRGKVVFLNFWASWCAPCRAEAKTLEAAWRKYKERGVVFLGVNIQDKEEDARAFIEEFGITYINGRDDTGKIAIDYGVWGIPESFFIDSQGRITYKHVGALDSSMISAKLDQARLGIVTAEEGRGDYRSVR